MTIAETDIKLYAAAVTNDTPEGGGLMSGREVVDGLSNNLFPDISELDRTLGRVSLRKAFAAVQTADCETFYGANCIIDQLPRDPNVGVVLFNTNQPADMRAGAVSRMESWLAKGPKYDGYLWEYHIAGQKSLLIIQRPDRPLPAVGDTLCIVKEPGSALEQMQFVRIATVKGDERAFTVQGRDFTRLIVTAGITEALSFDVQGGIPHFNDNEGETANGKHSAVHETIVADAAKYHGMTRTSDDVRAGQFGLTVDSIYAQLVPSAQTEATILDQRAHPGFLQCVQAAPGAVTVNFPSARIFNTQSLHLGCGIVPGSLAFSASGNKFTDDGAGALLCNDAEFGRVDYANGILSAHAGNAQAFIFEVSFIPAVYAPRNAFTAAFEITPASVSQSFVFMLSPAPARGTLTASFMMQGRWYTLKDDGSGAIRGTEPSWGAGSVNYETGTVSLTAGAVPDLDTTVLIAWGAPTIDTHRTGTPIAATMRIKLDDTGDLMDPDDPAPGAPIAPGTLEITWTEPADGTNSGVTKTARDNGAGRLTGAATGAVNYASGEIEFTPTMLPPPGTELRVDWQTGARVEKVFSAPARNASGNIDLQLDDRDILPGTVWMEYTLQIDETAINSDYAETYDNPEAAQPGQKLKPGGYIDNSARMTSNIPRHPRADIPHH